MYRRLLLPLDGSSLAERAIPYAEALARPSDAHIGVLRVHTDAILEPVDSVERYVHEIAAGLSGKDLSVDAAVAARDTLRVDPAHEIAREASARGADLIVMSTHGRSGLGRWLLGSVAEGVLHQATVPVLLIPAACEHEWPDVPFPAPMANGTTSPEPEAPARRLRVLATLDGSVHSEEVLRRAAGLAGQVGASLCLLRVVDSPILRQAHAVASPSTDATPLSEPSAVKRYLTRRAAMLRRRGHSVATRTGTGSAPAAIARIAREWEADVLVMGTRGRTGIPRLVLGSVALGTLHLTCLPTLLVGTAVQS